MAYYEIVYHLENAEMIPELHDDLSHFSFDCFRDVVKERRDDWKRSVHDFSPRFLECLKRLVCYHCYSCVLYIYAMMQPSPEADHTWRTFQADFDRMLCNVLEKYHSWPGLTILLGSILGYRNLQHGSTFLSGMVASVYLVRQQGEGHILDDMGFPEGYSSLFYVEATERFWTYFIELLEDPERSGTHAFDQERYATAAKECLQLYLCSHHKFSKGATQSACRDKLLLRNQPWAWKARMGVYSRVWESRRHLKVRQSKPLFNYQHTSFPENSPEHEYYRSLSYQWALDILPFLLERSEISFELAEVIRGCTFAMMAFEFPRRVRLARKAMAKYLLRVESTAADPCA